MLLFTTPLMKAMIFAAGLGTRLKPLTNTMPKALVPILKKPLLEHVIEKLKGAGFDEIIINIHHFGEQIIEFIEAKESFGIKIKFSDERKRLLDTGGAIKKASWFFDKDEPILIHNVDILSNIDIEEVYNQHIKRKSLATLVVSNRDTARYLLFDKKDNLKGWINKKTSKTKSPIEDFNPSNYRELAFSGIHVISAKGLVNEMDRFPDKFSIIDFYLSLCNRANIKAYLSNEKSMIDVGKLDSLKSAEEFMNQQ